MKLPDKVIIFGTPYTITYCDNPAEVDMYKRESLWGQIDYWTCTIRIYKNVTPMVEVWKSIFHELLHGLAHEAKIKMLMDKDNHEELDLLAGVLVDTMVRNGWFVVEEG